MALLALSIVIALSVLPGIAVASPGGDAPSSTLVAQDGREPMSPEDLVDQVLPAVVTVYNLTTMETSLGVEETVPQGSGTGFIIDDEGHIVTNWHVVTGGSEFAVMLFDETLVEAELIGLDPRDDLALVKIDPAAVPATVPLGDSDTLRQGQSVIAIGSPLGAFTNTVTMGIVSGLGRDDFGFLSANCANYANLIQHDAAINPGNSGGPLFNMYGEVVGVNTLGLPASRDGTPIQGLFFAVPSNLVGTIADQLIEDGRISAPFIGITSNVIDPATARANNLDIPGGVYVVAVTEGTPAADAGLRADDIITAIDGWEITMADPLSRIMLDYMPGDTVEFTVLRGNSEIAVELTFGNVPDEILAACELPITG